MKRGEWLTERPNLVSNTKTLTVCSIIDQARMMPSQKCKREKKKSEYYRLEIKKCRLPRNMVEVESVQYNRPKRRENHKIE